MERWGLEGGAGSVVLPPDEVVLEQQLASQAGATCQVWKGKLRGQEVAVKVVQLSPNAGDSDPLVKSLKRELAVLMHVSHQCDHVCRYLGFTRKGNQFCIVMRLYKQSLAQHIRRQPGRKLPIPAVLSLSCGILRGLCELHNLGVVVCDLKPDNVLISGLGEAFITDFGISHIVSNTVGAFSPTSMEGTFNYMAPEQMEEAPFGGITYKADMWAFACTVVHMMAGAPPMAGMNAMQIMTKISVLKVTPDLPQGLPTPIDALLRRCLSFFPHERPNARELLDAMMLASASAVAVGDAGAAAAASPANSAAAIAAGAAHASGEAAGMAAAGMLAGSGSAGNTPGQPQSDKQHQQQAGSAGSTADLSTSSSAAVPAMTSNESAASLNSRPSTSSVAASGQSTITWDQVACSEEGKAFLRDQGGLPAWVGAMLASLGYDAPDDLQYLTDEMLSQLPSGGLPPIQRAKLNKLIASRFGAGAGMPVVTAAQGSGSGLAGLSGSSHSGVPIETALRALVNNTGGAQVAAQGGHQRGASCSAIDSSASAGSSALLNAVEPRASPSGLSTLRRLTHSPSSGSSRPDAAAASEPLHRPSPPPSPRVSGPVSAPSAAALAGLPNFAGPSSGRPSSGQAAYSLGSSPGEASPLTGDKPGSSGGVAAGSGWGGVDGAPLHLQLANKLGLRGVERSSASSQGGLAGAAALPPLPSLLPQRSSNSRIPTDNAGSSSAGPLSTDAIQAPEARQPSPNARQIKVKQVGSNSLVVLADLLSAARESTIFDLCGRTLSGPLPPSCAGGLLVLGSSAPGCTLRNGTLLLPEGARLVLRGQGPRLEGLSVTGSGAKGASGDAPAGLVWVDGAQGACLVGCSVVGGTATDCSAVMANNGASAELAQCNLSGSKHHGGLLVWGTGSSVLVVDTKSQGNRYYGACVGGGASLELQDSDMRGNRSIGIAAWGAKTRLAARNCRMAANVDYAVYADGGAQLVLTGCSIQPAAGSGGTAGPSPNPAVQAWNAGTRVELRGCRLERGASAEEVSGGRVVVLER